MNNIKSLDTLIVSDWHLGFPGTQVKKINLFLDELLENKPFDKLILNGDIFDLNWQLFNKIIDTHQEIIKKIVKINQRGTKIIYILGNHDPLTANQKNHLYSVFNKFGLNDINILPAYQLNLNNSAFLVNHGHMFDTYTTEHKLASDWSDIGYRITIAFDNFLGIALTEIFTRFVRRYTKWSKIYEGRCRRYLQKRKYQGLILGHTHEPKILTWHLKQKGKFNLIDNLANILVPPPTKQKVIKFYYNSGDWIEPGHCTYLVISDLGEVELRYYN